MISIVKKVFSTRKMPSLQQPLPTMSRNREGKEANDVLAIHSDEIVD